MPLQGFGAILCCFNKTYKGNRLMTKKGRDNCLFQWVTLILALMLCLGLAGCAAFQKGSRQERALKKAIQADQEFTLQTLPDMAPPQRKASFRIADQGYQAIKEGRLQEAEDKLEKALSLDSGNPFCYLYLAEIRFRNEDIRQALMLLDQSAVLFHGHPYWLGEVYTRMGVYWEHLYSPEDARRAYQKALEYNPWNETSLDKLQEIENSGG